MLAAPFVTLLAGLAANAEARGEPQWQASLQSAGGRVEEDGALLLRPRAAYLRPQLGVTLSLPLVFRLHDRGPADPPTTAPWSDPGTYAASVEELRLRSRDAALALTAGVHGGDTLGFGMLVDGLTASHDPARPRARARADLRLPTIRAALSVADLTQPMLVAGRLEGAPLAWAGIGWGDRLWVGGEGAADPYLDDPQHPAVGGGALTLKLVAWRTARFAIAAVGGGALLSTGGPGAHVGILFEHLRDPLPGADAVSLRLEGVRAGKGYAPGLFGVAYASERFADGAGRASAAATWWLRARGDVRIGSVSGSLGLDYDLTGRLELAASLRISQKRWSAQAQLVQRHVKVARDLVSARPHAVAQLELAGQLWAGLFAFTSVSHAPRRDDDGAPHAASDWLVGLGYAGGGVF